MTAAVILQLAQEGKLSLDDPVSKYVPDVPNGDNITIAQLLEMRSGLYNYTNAPEISATIDRDPTKVWTPAELLAIAFAHPPNFPPGTEYEYNNTNYALLGLIAEKVDGKPLAQVDAGPVVRAAGICRTPCSPPAPRAPSPSRTRTATCMAAPPSRCTDTPPYSPEEKAAARAGTLLPNDYTGVNHSFAAAAGGVISTANDLATWIRALVAGRVLNAEYQRRWLDSLQPEDPSKPGTKVRVRHHPSELGTEHDLFSRRRDPRVQLENQLRPANQMTLIVWTNLAVSLDEQQTANTLWVKVLDQIYKVSPLHLSRRRPPRLSPYFALWAPCTAAEVKKTWTRETVGIASSLLISRMN